MQKIATIGLFTLKRKRFFDKKQNGFVYFEPLLYFMTSETTKTYNIGIIEDNNEWSNTLLEFFNKYAESENVGFNVRAYRCGEDFLATYKAKEFDIILMDIDLPGLNGMDTAKQLRKIDTEVAVIFVTNLAQYAVEGYEVNAFDFIVKPFTYYHFSVKMRRLLNHFEKRHDIRFWIKIVGGERKVINSATLKYVEVIKHNLIYHTEEGNFTALDSMANAVEKLKEASFALCNRCYLVNLKYVTGIYQYDVIVGGDRLLISHLKRNSFLDALNNYKSGGMSDA